MHQNRDVYGEINNETDMHRVFREIREDVDEADSRPVLTELYRRAGYLITLTYAPSWAEKFGGEAQRLRQVGEDEFRKTAHTINQRAGQIGTESNYKETWGKRA
jgi:hypothetical protein